MPHNRIKIIANFLGVRPEDLALGQPKDHGVTITADTASGYIGMAPTKHLSIGVIEDHAVRILHGAVEPGHIAQARALVIRNDRGPHIHICLCSQNDIQHLDWLALQITGCPSPLGREFPDVVIEQATGRAA